MGVVSNNAIYPESLKSKFSTKTASQSREVLSASRSAANEAPTSLSRPIMSTGRFAAMLWKSSASTSCNFRQALFCASNRSTSIEHDCAREVVQCGFDTWYSYSARALAKVDTSVANVMLYIT